MFYSGSIIFLLCLTLFAEAAPPADPNTRVVFRLAQPALDAPLLEKLAHIGIDCTFTAPVRHMQQVKAAAQGIEFVSDFNRVARILYQRLDTVPLYTSERNSLECGAEAPRF